MDRKKQKLLIEYLISSPDIFSICQSIVEPEYFDPEYRNSLIFIFDYFNEYHNIPDPDQIKAESDLDFDLRDITTAKRDYCITEVEKFCKSKAMEQAILQSVPLLQEENYGAIRQLVEDALLISLQEDLGIQYYLDVQDRLDRQLTNHQTLPTGWTEIDAALFGGIGRKELLLVSANSGGGKSITLANLARSFSLRKHNVLYISLELDQDRVGSRFDTMFTGFSKDWKKHTSEIAVTITKLSKTCGALDIVQLPSGTRTNDIRAYLKKYELHRNIRPDLIIIDYIDNMAPNDNGADGVWEKDKRCSEELRQLMVDYDAAGATASQLNRSAVGATEHNHSQIAGGISKINVCDVYWSIIMTDAMKARGEILFILQKTRNSDGVGSQILLKWNNKYLLIENNESIDSKKSLNFVSSSDSLIDTGDDALLDIMSDL